MQGPPEPVRAHYLLRGAVLRVPQHGKHRLDGRHGPLHRCLMAALQNLRRTTASLLQTALIDLFPWLQIALHISLDKEV